MAAVPCPSELNEPLTEVPDVEYRPVGLVDVSEASILLGVSVDTMRVWDRLGKLVPYRRGPRGVRLYRREDLVNRRINAPLARAPGSVPVPIAPTTSTPTVPIDAMTPHVTMLTVPEEDLPTSRLDVLRTIWSIQREARVIGQHSVALMATRMILEEFPRDAGLGQSDEAPKFPWEDGQSVPPPAPVPVIPDGEVVEVDEVPDGEIEDT